MVTIAEILSGKALQSNDRTTTYRWNEKDYPLPQSHNITEVCNNILQLQNQLGFLPILVSGKSESGKSTLVRTLIHRISCEAKPEARRIVQWFGGKDIYRMKEIINELPKDKHYALVLDDQSFVLDQAAPKKKKEIMEYFTVMRKDLGDEKKVKALFFMNMHYGRAMPPMLRDGYMRILTSMSDEDKKTWNEGFGWESQYQIRKFQKQFSSQMQNGYFYVNLNPDKSYTYYTDAPFRIALIKDLKGLHPFLFPKEGCDLCKPITRKINITNNIKRKQKELLPETFKRYKDDEDGQ